MISLVDFILFIITFYPLSLFYVPVNTTVHEYGHKNALKRSSKILRQEYLPVDIDYKPNRIQRKHGYTTSQLYYYFENHKQQPDIQKHIKFNAISGFRWECSLNLTVFICSLFAVKLFPNAFSYALLTLSIVVFFANLKDFIKSSDYKFFKHPEQFKYDPNFKK